ncbi:Protein of unknown function [Halopseudomonas xinjiangensis]|uniref:DUF2878 domain-containing protein n=1 Tax=Halopseudomonas xinjiangensis TaxID=487184 RepID=A0A1H1VZC0_9GAMM|nr:DUF2878 domain-containing protein [Halopseudomonas xinjiangensis]SDS90217.1 Protein of unknown function [Halopseudomonas xinjiangensis]
MPAKMIVNALLFQIGWFACLLGGTSWWLLLPLAVLVVHFTWISSWRDEGKLVITVMLAGGALDSFLLQMHLFRLPGDPDLVPLWLLLAWALFGTTLNHCLIWARRTWWLTASTGAIAGAFAYWVGAQLTDFRLGLGTTKTLAIVALIWAFLLPLLHGFARMYRQQQRLRKLQDEQGLS